MLTAIQAQAFFLSSEINCAVEMFSDLKDRKIEAHEILLEAIERYFAQAAVQDGSNVYKTLLPPIYLQQPGHSLTIIGFERRRDGTCNLVVFDPMYSTSPAMHKLLGRKNIRTARPEVLHAYRRSAHQLRKHASFEILMYVVIFMKDARASTDHVQAYGDATTVPCLGCMSILPSPYSVLAYALIPGTSSHLIPYNPIPIPFISSQQAALPSYDSFQLWSMLKLNIQVLRQFPDCRFVYAFFRARTLGYDVYPEDYFLPNFPWQQYGGLWVCDEARFARSEQLNPLNAQALRRITGEGASPRSNSSGNSPTSPFTSSAFHHLPAADAHMRDEGCAQLPSYVPSLDGSASGFLTTVPRNGSKPVFNMGGAHATLPQPQAVRPTLSLLTDVGRKYPGFPTPLSPTLSAKQTFPSPGPETGSRASTPRPLSPAVRSVSPMSMDGSEMCGPSRRCDSHGYEHYASSMGLIDSVIAQNMQPFSPPYSPSSSSHSAVSPTSPTRCLSPRSAMLRSMFDKQALQDLSHRPVVYSSSEHSSEARSLSAVPVASPRPRPSIQISNGTESSAQSPLSPSGTVLVYTSHRPVDSGLLGVRALSEPQVAEYRFWRPCGKRMCAFGCGGAQEGEWAAAKRLFKEAEEVSVAEDEAADAGALQYDGMVGEEKKGESVWAGRRLVTNWNQFLNGLEREGVAPF